MNMSYKDVITLLNAGYTKEEISGMDGAQPDPAAIPQPDPQPDPQPANAAIPQLDPQPATAAIPQPDPQPNNQPDLLAAIRELTAAVQANNRAAADMGANIINPIKAGQQAMAGIGGLKLN